MHTTFLSNGSAVIDKFEFPRREFYTVEKQVKEADFFLGQFKASQLEKNGWLSCHMTVGRRATDALADCWRYVG